LMRRRSVYSTRTGAVRTPVRWRFDLLNTYLRSEPGKRSVYMCTARLDLINDVPGSDESSQDRSLRRHCPSERQVLRGTLGGDPHGTADATMEGSHQ